MSAILLLAAGVACGPSAMFDNCDLEALAVTAAAERNRWEFMLMAAALPIRGGTGSPLNPIAVF